MNKEVIEEKAHRQTRRDKYRRKRERGKIRKTPKKKWDITYMFITFMLFSFVVYRLADGVIDRNKLANHGEYEIAYIYKESSHGPGGTAIYYKFEVDGIFYKGKMLSRGQSVGESILIVYLPSDPSINQDAEFIDAKRERQKKRQLCRDERAARRAECGRDAYIIILTLSIQRVLPTPP